MDSKNIKIGKITEEELVNLFGSDAQKKSYKEKGRFVSSYKSSMFKKINKYCAIKEINNTNNPNIKSTYEITEVYEHPK